MEKLLALGVDLPEVLEVIEEAKKKVQQSEITLISPCFSLLYLCTYFVASLCCEYNSLNG